MTAVPDAATGQDASGADFGGPVAGYDPAAYETVCAKAVMYRNDLTHPRARQLHTDLSGDGNARLRQMIRSVCAVLWRTPNDVPQRYRKGQTVVLNVSDARWPAGTGAFVLSFDTAFFGESWPSHTDEILGRTTHEVGHLHYFYPGEPAPAWVVEGMLDFIRLKLGHINRQDIMNARRSHYCASYKPAGLLFEWLESRHPGFVHQFNLWIEANRTRPWPGTSSIVSELTGMSLEAHWQAYTRNYNVSPPVMSCN
jgi:hypothetical protein